MTETISHISRLSSRSPISALQKNTHFVLQTIGNKSETGKPYAYQSDFPKVMAILELARVIRNAGSELPLISAAAILSLMRYTINSTHDDPNSDRAEMVMRLRVLASSLRLFKYEGLALSSRFHDDLYHSITELDQALKTSRKGQKIEQWDLAFLLQHCRYLLVSIEGSSVHGKNAAEKFLSALDSLSGSDAKTNTERQNFPSGKSTRTWKLELYEKYLKVEDLCFAIFARNAVNEQSSDQILDLQHDEWSIAFELSEILEKQLKTRPQERVHPLRGFSARKKKSGQNNIHQYDESDYLEYGLLDLMYHLSYWIRARQPCFKQFIKSISLVLKLSSEYSLHRKAIDLYQLVNKIASSKDETVYGGIEERKLIEKWITGAHNYYGNDGFLYFTQ